MQHKLALVLILTVSNIAFSFDNSQLTFRLGVVQGSYANPLVNGGGADDGGANVKSELEGGGFMVVPTLDFEFESFKTFNTSYYVRTIIAMDSASGKMKYNYFGLGLKKYWKGIGRINSFKDEKNSINIKSKQKLYWGIDVGMSRVAVVSFGSVLSAVSTGLDFGGNLGYVRGLSDNWSMVAQVGVSYAFGISTISSSGVNIKILGGITYQFN